MPISKLSLTCYIQHAWPFFSLYNPPSHFVSSCLRQVTLIPTHDTEVTRDWYQQTHERQQDLNIMVLASSSTVVMQDESFPACKIEFWASRAPLCFPPPPPAPLPSSPSLSSVHTGGRARANSTLLLLQSFSLSHGTSLKRICCSSQYTTFC